MTITKKEILKLGELAKIGISENEVEELQNQLNKILKFVDKINEPSVINRQNSIKVNAPQNSRLRPDQITENVDSLSISKNCPASSDALITVPLVIE